MLCTRRNKKHCQIVIGYNYDKFLQINTHWIAVKTGLKAEIGCAALKLRILLRSRYLLPICKNSFGVQKS